MLKISFYLIIALCVAQLVQAQTSDSTNTSTIKKYTLNNTEKQNNSNKYFIATILNNNLSSQKCIVRQLNNKNVIVDISDKNYNPNNFKLIGEANNLWKLNEELFNVLNDSANLKTSIISTFYLIVKDTNLFKQQYASQLSFKYYYPNICIVKTNYNIIKKLLADDNITYIEQQNYKPHDEGVAFHNLFTNRINVVQANNPLIDGTNTKLSLRESLFNPADIDVENRIIPSTIASNIITGHATSMATIAVGAGNLSPIYLGVAPNAKISSAANDIFLPDPINYYLTDSLFVQNHSYGASVENFYGAGALGFDGLVSQYPFINQVFSAGNLGTSIPTIGTYAGIGKFANITGNFKEAKNIICVGATDTINHVADFSSRGPAFDGRLKPDLIALGEDGSSGAAALVSGTLLLLQQQYKLLHNNQYPPASLLKALLVNGCDDVAQTGPDYSSGFGQLNADKSIKQLQRNNYVIDSVANNAIKTFTIHVPANAKNLKVSLVYTDLPATANTAIALVNDLDVSLKYLPTNTIYLPWVLSSFPNADSLNALAIRKADHLNNVEQITIDNPLAGDYEINTSGFKVTNTNQTYAIAYTWDTLNTFQWDYPAKNNNLISTATNYLLWHVQTTATSANIDISYNAGNTYQPIATNINPQTGYFKWITPDSFAVAKLRITMGAQQYFSDTFTISRPLNVTPLLNCTDSFAVNWQRINQTNKYAVYKLGTLKQEYLKDVTDTFFIAQKNNFPNTIISVAPYLPFNYTGIRSTAIDYSNSSDCYLHSFTGDNYFDTAFLSLQLSSTYNLTNIIFEKQTTNGWITINQITNPTAIIYSIKDFPLNQGNNIYRVTLILKNNIKIISNEVNITGKGLNQTLIYPNPVKAGTPFNIILNSNGNYQFKLINVLGQSILTQQLPYYNNIISLPPAVKSGVYWLVIYNSNNKLLSTKLIIL